jgi:CRP/FNR family cyclic AMP-dependent transcriptional regulator
MPAVIRQATPADAPLWLDLMKATLGEDHPAKQAYDSAWVARQLDRASGNDTWVAANGNKIEASVTILSSTGSIESPVMNLGRNLFRAEAFTNGSGEALVRKIHEVADGKKAMAVVRVLASDNPQQILFESQGFDCVGFQPLKHMHRAREGVLFYVRANRDALAKRVPMMESLPQVAELATVALNNLRIPNPMGVREGVSGYPLKMEITFHDATAEDFELWRAQALTANPAREVSGGFNLGCGYLRVSSPVAVKAVLGQRDGKVVAGISYFLDDQDRCVRVVDSFSTDDLSVGALLHHLVKLAQGQLSAVYLEVDILITAPQLLKSAEQLGFVAVTFLPAFYPKNTGYTDIIKMVKLNTSYSPEVGTMTASAKSIVEIIDHSLQDQKMGVAIINLLRGLPIFEGLGDGELRKMARLFTQKLYRPGERVFTKGDLGNEAYVVMRGQIDICLDEQSKPIASLSNGQIFGELAFLDGAARVAMAIASQASILLVVQRSAFNDVVQREPHLGMVVMRNVAMDLSNKLRRANSALSTLKK